MLTLHHQPDRRQTYREMQPFRYSQELECLCVFDADIIAAIFRSDKFNVVFFADQYRYITEHTSLDFGAAATAFDHIPLANEGDRHKQLRMEMASLLGVQSREKIKLMEDFVAMHTAHLFSAGKEIDLAEEFAQPIFLQLFSLWLGVDHSQVVEDANVSQVFDMKMSLNRRKKMNQNVETLTCAFARMRDQIPTSPEIATAMNILGNDALKGSLSLSLWEVLARNPGARLDEIDYPPNVPSTGVPYIERVAIEDIEVNGMAVTKGQRVRLFLDATTYHVSGEDADLLFGKGRHLCLGKPMMLAIWRSLIKTLGALPLYFTTGDMKLRTGDYAFSYPEYARVTIHD